MKMKFYSKVQALWAGVVGVSPLPNVLVDNVPKWVYIDSPFINLYSADDVPNCDLTDSLILLERSLRSAY